MKINRIILAGVFILFCFSSLKSQKKTLAATSVPVNSCSSMIYGIGQSASSTFSSMICVVDPLNGSQSHQTNIPGLYMAGIGKIPNQLKALLTNYEPGQPPGTVCISGTTFYFVDLTLPNGFGGIVKLGTTPYKHIEDIEADLVTKYMYGIYQDQLVRIGTVNFHGYGTPCPYATSPVIVFLGKLSNVGTGPYALSFDYAGNCTIMSLNDRKRANVHVPTAGSSTPSPFVLTTSSPVTTVTYSGPNMFVGLSGIAACTSGQTQFIGIEGGMYPVLRSFYQWAQVGTTFNYSFKGSNCLRDYTSTPFKCTTYMPN